MIKRISVIKESSTGRNILFKDIQTKHIMLGKIIADKILKGEYSGYHIRNINGVPTPVSNPDHIRTNNLG